MTDPERAAFVKWFIHEAEDRTFEHGHPLLPQVAELAAQAVEQAVRADRDATRDSILSTHNVMDTLLADNPIPWRAAMGADVETAGVRPATRAQRIEAEHTGSAGTDEAANCGHAVSDPGAAEPPQIPPEWWRYHETAKACRHKIPYCVDCSNEVIDETARQAYADCERIARENDTRRWHIADAIAAKRKEVCGE